MEADIVKELENIMCQSISPDTRKVIIIHLDLKMSGKQFRKFQEWIKHNGFIETVPVTDDTISRLFLELGYNVLGYDECDSKRRILRYKHYKEKKTIFVTYTVDDIVTIEEIIYFERI